ncbi:MAG TPA: hypothetical protein VF590_27750 [Isosphaeraceae bacterium]|jgi:hypothetical protein
MDSEEPVIVVEDKLITRVNRTQAEHFTHPDSNCRVLRMPDGVLLRYTLHHSQYFFLTSENADGYVVTRIFASDTAYDRQKIKIGEVRTPMFDHPETEPNHLQQVEVLLRTWIEFIAEDIDSDQEFKTFGLKSGPQ